ncbi:hypothetical protein ACN469_11655 [Corallococcus terminator]
MKHSLAVTAVLLSLSLLGCGGPVSEPALEPEAVSESGESSTVSQFGTCTAQCSGGQTVSCSGNTCSQTDYQGVTCDGVFTACPSSPACTGHISCSVLVGKRCFIEGETQPCCDGASTTELYCAYYNNNRFIWVH